MDKILKTQEEVALLDKNRILDSIALMGGMVEEGNMNPLKAYDYLHFISKQVDKAMKVMKGHAIEEAEKHGAKTFQYNGSEMTLSEGRKTYSFKNVPCIVELEEQLKELKEVSKRANKKGGVMPAIIDGVVYDVEPCVITYSEGSISIKQGVK